MGRLGVATCLVLLAGCAKQNPVWGLTGADSDSASGSASSTSTTATTEPNATTSGSDAGTTSTASTTVTTTTGSTSTTGLPTTDGSSGSTTGGNPNIPPCGFDVDVLAYYRFEDIPGNSMADTMGIYQGFMWEGSDPTPVPGPPGCGDAFGASPSVAGRVPDSPAFDLSVGSIDFWVQPPPLTAVPRALVSRDAQGAATEHVTILIVPLESGPNGHLVVRHQAFGEAAARCSDAPLPEGVWAHVAYNFGPPGVELYIDGVLQTSTATALVPGGPIVCGGTFDAGVQTDNDWYIAGSVLNQANGDPPPGFFLEGGAIDEVRISTVRRNFGG